MRRKCIYVDSHMNLLRSIEFDPQNVLEKKEQAPQQPTEGEQRFDVRIDFDPDTLKSELIRDARLVQIRQQIISLIESSNLSDLKKAILMLCEVLRLK